MHRRDSQYIPLPGADPTLVWETPELALDHIEAFLSGVRRITAPTRVLATVLFTDIVDSTGRASRLGSALAGAAGGA